MSNLKVINKENGFVIFFVYGVDCMIRVHSQKFKDEYTDSYKREIISCELTHAKDLIEIIKKVK